MVTAQASGFDILSAIARWTSEQFPFVKVDEGMKEPEPTLQYSSLQATLDKHNVSERIAPTQFPEGTELTDIKIRNEKNDIGISATYTLGEEKFFISIRSSAGIPNMEIEINDPNIESYWAGGIEHHLMTDVRQQKVMWRNGP